MTSELRQRTTTEKNEDGENVKLKNTEKNENENENEKEKKIEKKEEEEEQKKGGIIQNYINDLFEEEDSSYIALFRILWGLTMFLEIYLLIRNDFQKLIHSYYLNPHGWNFKYYLFEWVETMPFEFMKLYVLSLLVASIFITLGIRYRLSSIYFFFGISYLFLCESINYLNHIYLVCVISFIMIFLPCNCCYSVDAYKRPSIYRPTLPKIILVFLKSVLIIVYAFAGVVKINEDWLRGEPLRHWVGFKDDTIYGDILSKESTIYFLSYGGLIYDLIVGILLLWSRTFWIGIIATLFFHISNKIMFNIGIFPYLMIASTSLFFSPWRFRYIIHKLKTPFSSFEKPKNEDIVHSPKKMKIRKIKTSQKLILFFAILFLLFWILFPVRNLFYPGDVVWNEHGHVYSWRMKLRDKDCHGVVYGYQPQIEQTFIVPVDMILARNQFAKVFNRPWLFTQFAHFAADLYSINNTRAEIYTYWYCSVNYRPIQLYADPFIDYASVPKFDWFPWITELIPLPEETKSQYPWNWEWNFNWLYGINDELLIPSLETEEKERRNTFKTLINESKDTFTKFIADKHYNGDTSRVGLTALHVRGTNMVAKKFWDDYFAMYGAYMPPESADFKPKFLDQIL